jgi:hypothetical protein
MSSEAQQMQAKRNALKKRYLGLYDRVTSILFRVDPMGINFEDNTDEYDPETDTILPRLPNCSSPDDVRKVVIEEFERWFDSDMVNAGNRKHFDEIASAIWSELQISRGANLLTTNTEQDATSNGG